MKKVMVLVVLAVLFVSFFGAVVAPAFADDGENFKKAGRQALSEREQVLASKSDKYLKFYEVNIILMVISGILIFISLVAFHYREPLAAVVLIALAIMSLIVLFFV